MDVLAFGFGGLLLLVGLLGGGFEVRELKIPKVSWAPRLFTTIAGLVFVWLGIGLNTSVGPTVAGDDKVKLPPTSVESASLPIKAPTTPGNSIADRDPIATDKAGLMSAIRLADDAEAQANQTLDPNPLYGVYTGEALRTELASLQSLKSKGLFVHSVLEDQQFQSFKVSQDGLSAEVRVIEIWSSIYYSTSDGQCVGQVPSHRVPQTISLIRKENGWVIEAVVHDGQALSLAPC